MKERPIIFDQASVRGILNGTKTQTRRVVKPQPEFLSNRWCRIDKSFLHNVTDAEELASRQVLAAENVADALETSERCPYGYAYADGTFDRLWVREAWTWFMDGIVFRADTTPFSEEQRMAYGVRWRSPIHMSRLESRITLEITDVRVQRVQEISEIDCEAELGLKPYSTGNAAYLRFMERWEKLNATRGYTWESNPWVWVVEFRLVQP